MLNLFKKVVPMKKVELFFGKNTLAKYDWNLDKLYFHVYESLYSEKTAKILNIDYTNDGKPTAKATVLVDNYTLEVLKKELKGLTAVKTLVA